MHWFTAHRLTVTVLPMLAACLGAAEHLELTGIEQIDVRADGSPGHGSSAPVVSQDGRYVAFESTDDVAGGGADVVEHLYLRDRAAGRTVLVDHAYHSSAHGDSYAGDAAISGSGRYLVFSSASSDLIHGGDRNGVADIYLYDTARRSTTRISRGLRCAEPNGNSYAPAISDDGRYIVFLSWASNLVAGDTNEVMDLFLHDRWTGLTHRIDPRGHQNGGYFDHPWISADGRTVVFASTEGGWTDDGAGAGVFAYDIRRRTFTRLSITADGRPADGSMPSISRDGRIVAFGSFDDLAPGARSAVDDVFVRDRRDATTTCASASIPAGVAAAAPVVSNGGRYVAVNLWSWGFGGGTWAGRRVIDRSIDAVVELWKPETHTSLAPFEVSFAGSDEHGWICWTDADGLFIAPLPASGTAPRADG